MTKIRYARVSSKVQNLDRQLQDLESASKVISNKMRATTTERPQLQEMLKFIREDDIVVVAELDRLGRNNTDLTDIMNVIQQKRATLEVLNLPSMNGISDDNLRRLFNNLAIELYKYKAEPERKRIIERQTPAIPKRLIDDGRTGLFPYTRPRGKKDLFRKHEFSYDY